MAKNRDKDYTGDSKMFGEEQRYKLIAKNSTGKILNLGGVACTLNDYLKKKFDDVHSVDILDGADYKIDLNNSDWAIKDKFDTIVAGEVIEHISNPTQFLTNCYKLLNKKGKLILTTPNATSLLHLKNPSWCVLHDRKEEALSHIHTFTSGMLKFLFERRGFKNIKISYLNTFTYNRWTYLLCSFVKRLRADILIIGEK